jgi:hypothetical protein
MVNLDLSRDFVEINFVVVDVEVLRANFKRHTDSFLIDLVLELENKHVLVGLLQFTTDFTL